MIRIGFFAYSELPDETHLTARLGRSAAARLTMGRRGKARTEALLGGCLLAQMLPDANLSRIDRTETGRPYFSDRPDVDFNLSHTEGAVVCALETDGSPRVGIDVECMTGRTAYRMARIAKRWFTEAEQARWRIDPTERTFLTIWTAKEAAAKWDGNGLRILREIDTASTIPVEHTYFLGDMVVTLACTKGKTPPEEIVRIPI